MLVLGHVGITFAVALAAESVASRSRIVATGHGLSKLRKGLRAAIVSLSKRVDLRILLIASVLPDVIDKPIGLVLFPNVFGTGRLLAHALVFPFALAIAGAWLYRSRHSVILLTLAYGATMHLVLDAMWRTPSVLFWPFAGPLPLGANPDGWLTGIFTALLTNPAAYLPEIAGAILLLPLLFAVVGRTGMGRFLRSGSVD